MTIWIGEIQWMIRHGLGYRRDPILKSLNHIENRDALLDLTDPSKPAARRDWPEAEFIVGSADRARTVSRLPPQHHQGPNGCASDRRALVGRGRRRSQRATGAWRQRNWSIPLASSTSSTASVRATRTRRRSKGPGRSSSSSNRSIAPTATTSRDRMTETPSRPRRRASISALIPATWLSGRR